MRNDEEGDVQPWYRTRDGQVGIAGGGMVVLCSAFLLLTYAPLPAGLRAALSKVGFGALVVLTAYAGRAALTTMTALLRRD